MKAAAGRKGTGAPAARAAAACPFQFFGLPFVSPPPLPFLFVSAVDVLGRIYRLVQPSTIEVAKTGTQGPGRLCRPRLS